MLLRTFFLLILIQLTVVLPAPGQSEFEWEEVELDSKIAYEYVSDFFFDHKQYLWISSHRGLYRVNGYSSKYYVFNPNTDNSLLTNVIYNCYVDNDDQLWILTDNGVQEYQYDTDDFRLVMADYLKETTNEYRTSGTTAIQLDDEHLLIGSKEGAIRYNKKSGEYQHYQIEETIVQNSYSTNAHVLSLQEDKRDANRIIAYTMEGFYYYYKKENRFEKAFENPEIDLYWRKHAHKNLVTTKKGIYFTAMKSVYHYNFSSKKYSKIFLPWRDTGRKSGNIHIRNFIKIEGKLYVSTIGHGLYEVDIENQHKARLINPGTYNHVTLDRNSNLWIVKKQKLLKSKEKLGAKNESQRFLEVETFKVNNKLTELDSTSINLRNFERNISGTITLINPENKNNTSYFYSTEPKKDQWIKLVGSRKFELQNLNQGKTLLQFKAINEKQEVVKSAIFTIHVDRYFYEEWWFLLLVFSTVLFFLASIYFLVQSRKREREKHKENLLHMELNSLRSQMNPHFLFNTLNSIKNYMLTKNPDEAGDYLTKFSQLIRCILENSKSQFLTLDQELKAINLYIHMEQMRFDDDFKYLVNIDPEIDIETFKVAPMLIQPFIENAIWHGLMPKKENRELLLELSQYEKGVKCVVQDNGIGRDASQKMYENRREKKNSLGLKITAERIANINLLYNIKVHSEIEDLEEGGTRVSIYLPLIKQLS